MWYVEQQQWGHGGGRIFGFSLVDRYTVLVHCTLCSHCFSQKCQNPTTTVYSGKATSKDMHLQWYNIIRAIVSDRITTEQDRMPSHTSMLRHWFHSCCIAGMWFNFTEEDIQQELPAPELCGWKKNENRTYEYDWECQMVQRHVQDTINFLTIGCGCKKRCQTNTVVDLVAVARTVRIFNSLF